MSEPEFVGISLGIVLVVDFLKPIGDGEQGSWRSVMSSLLLFIWVFYGGHASLALPSWKPEFGRTK